MDRGQSLIIPPLFDEQTIKATQRIPISFHSQLDKWIWTATSNGQISMKLAY